MGTYRGQQYRAAHRGFTLRELVVVVGVLVLLSMLTATYVNKSWKSARRVNCMSNMRQLAAAFFQYTADNDGMLPQCDLNADVLGRDDGSQNDLPYLRQYVGDSRIFHCPEDLRDNARTYAINDYLGGQNVGITHAKMVQHVLNPPSTFLMIEEQAPITYNAAFGGFIVLPAPITRWSDTPGILHESGTCLSFFDGHVEYWHWDDSRTLNLPLTKFPNTPNNPDLIKLQSIAGSKAIPKAVRAS
jgi:prepilin-type N-terminal cleavage/methylation domain-containing protein